MVQIKKLARPGLDVPLLAAFPFEISVNEPEAHSGTSEALPAYGGRGFSTCHEDESVCRLFTTKSDVKRDD